MPHPPHEAWPAADVESAHPARNARHKQLSTKHIIVAITTAALLAAAYYVRLPYFESSPGDVFPIEPIITLGTETTELDGSVALLTVQVQKPNAFMLLGAALDPDVEIDPISAFVPRDVDLDAFFDAQEAVFEQAFITAVAVGYNAVTDQNVLLEHVFVAEIDQPRSGLSLQVGDRIVSLEGSQLLSAGDLVDILRDVRPGADVTLVVERDGPSGEPTQLELVSDTVERPDQPHPALGVLIESRLPEDLELPFTAELDEDTKVGGPSAGLMIAVTVADLISEEDLLQGLDVAGTGSIDGRGRVGPIGGVHLKVRAAIDEGYDAMFVPVGQMDDARRGARGDAIELVEVATLDDALEWLRRQS